MCPPTPMPGPLRAVHQDRRVPPDVGADAPLDVLVAGEPRLPLGRDGVDVVGGGQRRHADLPLAGALQQPQHHVAGALPAALVDDAVERLDPLERLLGIDVGELARQTVADHRALAFGGHRRSSIGEVSGVAGGAGTGKSLPPSCPPPVPAVTPTRARTRRRAHTRPVTRSAIRPERADRTRRCDATEVITVRTGGRPSGGGHHGRGGARSCAGRGDGLLHVFVPHATAGVAIIETGAGSDDDLLARARRRAAGRRPVAAPARLAGPRPRPRAAGVRRAVRHACRSSAGGSRSAPGSRSAWSTPTATTRPGRSGFVVPAGLTCRSIARPRNDGCVTTPRSSTSDFRAAVGGADRAGASRRDPAATRSRRAARPSPARRPWSSSMPSSPAGTSTWPPAGCAASARASTRSGRPGHEGNAAVAAARAADRPGPAALPLRRVLLRPGRPGRRDRADPGRAARAGRGGDRADRGRPAQGLRPSRPGHRPDDLDDRLAPAAGGRAGVRDRARARRVLGRRLGPAGMRAPPRDRQRRWPDDAIVVCSFGDASVNHAVAQAAFNTAGWFDHSGAQLPVLFVCEDNGHRHQRARRRRAGCAATLRQPARAALLERRTGATWPPPTTRRVEAAEWVRGAAPPGRAAPGHGPADGARRRRRRGRLPQSAAEIAADLDRDPLVADRDAAGRGRAAHARTRCWPATTRSAGRCAGSPRRCIGEPKLASAGRGGGAAGAAPAGPGRPGRRRRRRRGRRAGPGAPGWRRSAAGCRRRPARSRWPRPSTPPSPTRWSANPAMVLFGEDVAAKGGVYGVTKGLRDRFGPGRVFDTLLDETSILGLALGAGLGGLLPVPEIQYLAYLHNAEDQLRGEAASLQFFSAGRVPQPDGGPGGRAGLPGGVRRALPQRQLGGRAARHPRAGGRRCRPGRPRPRRCCGPAWPRPRSTAASASSSSRSRSTTPATCTPTGDNGWLAPYAAAGGLGPRPRHDRAGPGLRRRRAPDDRHLRQRGADVAAGGGPAGRARGRRPGGRPALAEPAARGRPGPGGRRDRTGAGRGRDPAQRRRRRGRAGRAGRRRVRRARSAGSSAVDSYVPLGDAAKHLLVSEEMIEQGARSLLGA